VTELVAGHLEGFRVWRIVRHNDEPALRSLTWPFVWPAGYPITSWCPRGCSRPTTDHECGVWAYSDRHDAEQLAERSSRVNPAGVYVVGKIAGAGRIVQHEDGFRAQRAAVLELHTTSFTGRRQALDTAGHELLEELVARAAVLYGCALANA
jgi:hypothetical protein